MSGANEPTESTESTELDKAVVAGTAARRARQQARKAEAGRVQEPPARRGGGVTAPTRTAPAVTAVTPTRRALDPDRLVALEEERDFLLRSLDDLEREHDAGDVDDRDYVALQDDYTARAAAVLRAIENRQAVLDAARPVGNRRRTVVIGVLVLAFSVGLGVVVAQSSGRRTQGQTISGDIRQSTRDQLLQAQQLMADGSYTDAIAVYDEVLAVNPDSPEALTYKGWLLRLTARQSSSADDQALLLARSLALLDHAVTADPSYPDAHVFRAVVLRDVGRPADALDELDRLAPDAIPAFMTDVVTQLRDELRAATGTQGTTPGTAAPAP